MDPATIAAIVSVLKNVGEFAFGQKGKTESTFDPKQMQARNALLDQALGGIGGANVAQQPGYQTGMDYLQGLFNDPSFFNRFEAPLQRQFQEQIIPDLANRFGGMGSGGALDSSAFQNLAAREGTNLATNIAALRGGLQQQAIPQLLGYSQQPFQNILSLLQTGLGTGTQNVYRPATTGVGGPAIAAFLESLGTAGGQRLGQSLYGPSAPAPQEVGGGMQRGLMGLNQGQY